MVQDTRPEGHKRNITPLPVSQDRSMATFAHFSGIIGFCLPLLSTICIVTAPPSLSKSHVKP